MHSNTLSQLLQTCWLLYLCLLKMIINYYVLHMSKLQQSNIFKWSIDYFLNNLSAFLKNLNNNLNMLTTCFVLTQSLHTKNLSTALRRKIKSNKFNLNICCLMYIFYSNYITIQFSCYSCIEFFFFFLDILPENIKLITVIKKTSIIMRNKNTNFKNIQNS